MRQLKFTVDSRLLRELGERLVGRPHIALAELVKNSYDADASKVEIKFLPDRIEVTDNGHGMSPEEFEGKWLRIGSTHKEREAFSPELHRPLTGSKGVGRLAVQLLANHLEIHSVSKHGTGDQELVAYVDWAEAVEAGDLTEAPVIVDEVDLASRFANDSTCGTRLILKNLNSTWNVEEFEDLARELWPLQPPFEDYNDEREAFVVALESPYKSFVRAFEIQMAAALELWTARLKGELLEEGVEVPGETIVAVRQDTPSGEENSESWDSPRDFTDIQGSVSVPNRVVRLSLEFPGQEPETVYYNLPQCHIDSVHFEIRVYNFRYRQPKGITVEEARAYLRRFGGVHVYDAGFHLPYYGPDTDWLHIEIDHSHRLSRSRLLPADLQRPGGLSDLPTNSRLFGVVNVNTAHEQRTALSRYGTAIDALAIQVSRDRLTETPAYRDVVRIVRWALDYYAMRSKFRDVQRSRKDRIKPQGDRASERLQRLQETLSQVKEDLPEDTFEELSEEMDRVLRETEAEEKRYESYLGLLGALATAGISALAYEHEVNKQFETLEEIALDLADWNDSDASDGLDLSAVAVQLQEWIERARATHTLFNHLLQEQNRTIRQRFPARRTIEQVKEQIAAINPGVEINLTDVAEDLTLPPGRYAEWSAILQNILTNAFNAMREMPIRRIDISSHQAQGSTWLLVEDTGVGVDVANAEELFEPFVRRLRVGPDHAAMALGGGGLGLTIVRMMAEELGCTVRFVRPDPGHKTAVRITWRSD